MSAQIGFFIRSQNIAVRDSSVAILPQHKDKTLERTPYMRQIIFRQKFLV